MPCTRMAAMSGKRERQRERERKNFISNHSQHWNSEQRQEDTICQKHLSHLAYMLPHPPFFETIFNNFLKVVLKSLLLPNRSNH